MLEKQSVTMNNIFQLRNICDGTLVLNLNGTGDGVVRYDKIYSSQN
jgi:hypothetical protein